MSEVAKRLEQAPACAVISLTDGEAGLYHGCGVVIARFDEKATMVDLMYLSDLPHYDLTRQQSQKAMDAVRTFLSQGGECWMAMASCYQLCDPHPLSLDDPAFLDLLGRALG